MEHDLHNNLNDVMVLTHQTIGSATTTVGEIVDTAGYESLEFLITSATVTDGVFTVLLEDGDDAALADAATVSSELTLGTLPVFILTDDDIVKRVGCISKKRYVRLSIVSTGITSGGALGAVAVQGHPRVAPVAQ